MVQYSGQMSVSILPTDTDVSVCMYIMFTYLFTYHAAPKLSSETCVTVNSNGSIETRNPIYQASTSSLLHLHYTDRMQTLTLLT